MNDRIPVSSREHSDHKLKIPSTAEERQKALKHRSSVSQLHELYNAVSRFPHARKLVEDSGFSSFFKVHYPKPQDNCLTTGIFERWWHTTNTFHFSSFEIGFTPLEFTQITGILIGRGNRISLVDISMDQLLEIAPQTIDCLVPYLNAKATTRRRKGGEIMVIVGIEEVREEILVDKRVEVVDRYKGIRKSLIKVFLDHRLGQENNVLEKEQIARSFLIWCFGNVLFPNKNNVVEIKWLNIIRDLNVLRHYDWRSSLYGSILWGLNTGVTCNKPDLQFFSYPLMPWFWAYFRCLFPYTKAENENMDPWPAGRLYDGDQRDLRKGAQSDTGTHSVTLVRYHIDNFPLDSVVWSPWEDSEWKTNLEVVDAR
ncbi:uncharacterized protein LOC113325242 [Papaver somniferum]|uniref:uncharacterized protein LOC113325242 n=1 Tax=Papaver somniferum TaxID=3469 RepID=UPI000E6FA6A8|nr:uncharacterized protein LOC113325242 [Papaver somniferum]